MRAVVLAKRRLLVSASPKEKRNDERTPADLHDFGGNMPYIEEQYENYLADPASVEPKWRAYLTPCAPVRQDVAHQPVIDAFAAMAQVAQGGDGEH